MKNVWRLFILMSGLMMSCAFAVDPTPQETNDFNRWVTAWEQGDREAFEHMFKYCNNLPPKPLCQRPTQEMEQWITRWWPQPEHENTGFNWSGTDWMFKNGKWQWHIRTDEDNRLAPPDYPSPQ